MIHSDNYRKQLKLLAPVLIFFLGLATAILLAIGLMRVFFGVDIGELTRDPIHKTGLHPFVGFISNLGIILWGFTAAICFFSAYLLKRSRKPRRLGTFYLVAGIITTWLMLDDLFLIHDVILREYVGILEYVTYPLYVAATAAFFYIFRERVMKSEYIILVIAAALFFTSMLFDLFSDRQLLPGNYLFEDGFKFMGIIAWLIYFARTSFADVMTLAGSTRRSRMQDGVCSRCGSTNVSFSSSRSEPDLPVVPLSAVHRYEKPDVTPLHNNNLSVICNDCNYCEHYLSDKMKLVSVNDDRRRAS